MDKWIPGVNRVGCAHKLVPVAGLVCARLHACLVHVFAGSRNTSLVQEMREKERHETHKSVLGPYGNMLGMHKLMLGLYTDMFWTHKTIFKQTYFGNSDAIECLYGLFLQLFFI